MAPVPPTDSVPRRMSLPLLGVVLSLIAPVGWFILQIPHQGLWSWPEVKVELYDHALLYGYMTLGSGLCFAVAGYLIGRAFDAMLHEQREVRAQASAMEGLNLRLEAISVTDELTGMYNRRYFFERLEEYLRAARRHRLPLSLMMIDIDLFKRVNDNYGHPAGDRVLRTIAELIRSGLRASDISARYGGEEFIILLPYTDETEARRLAHRLLTTVSSHPFPLPPEAGQMTISIGLSQLDVEHPVSGETLISRADGALYRAKRGGRNQVSVAASTPTTAENRGENRKP